MASAIDGASAAITSTLDTLPPEILLDILRRVLVSPDQPVHFMDSRQRGHMNSLATFIGGPAVSRSPKLDLLLVNKAIYFAGIKAYFGSSTLDLRLRFKEFVATVGSDRKSHIRNMELMLQRPFVWRDFETYVKVPLLQTHFEHFTALQKLVINVESGIGNRSGYTEDERAKIQRHIDGKLALKGVKIEYRMAMI